MIRNVAMTVIGLCFAIYGAYMCESAGQRLYAGSTNWLDWVNVIVGLGVIFTWTLVILKIWHIAKLERQLKQEWEDLLKEQEKDYDERQG